MMNLSRSCKTAGARLSPLTFILIALFTNPASAAETVTYYYTSSQGTVLATTDAAGNVVSTADYRPYGLQALGVPERGPGYTGHVNDPDSGLIYMQARYYEPGSGRFLSVDPDDPEAGNVFNFNRYAYANDNPIRYTDPTGRVVRLENDVQTLLALINSRAAGTFTADKNGNLQAPQTKGDTSKGSSTYSDALVKAINSKSTISVSIGSDYKDPKSGQMKSVDNDAGGGVTIGRRTGGDQKVTISGNSYTGLKDVSGGPLRDTPDDILSHELVGHAIPRVVGGGTGNAVENENKVRSEVPESGERGAEPDHKE